MDRAVDFRRDNTRGLAVAMGFMGIGVAFLCLWLNAMYGLDWGSRNYNGIPRKEGGYILVALVGFGFGLWDLYKLGDKRVLVRVDDQGITDFRLDGTPIPWAEVEQIADATIGKGRGVRLILREGAPTASRLRGGREVVIWKNGLEAGPQGLTQAIARLAPQVPHSSSATAG